MSKTKRNFRRDTTALCIVSFIFGNCNSYQKICNSTSCRSVVHFTVPEKVTKLLHGIEAKAAIINENNHPILFISRNDYRPNWSPRSHI